MTNTQEPDPSDLYASHIISAMFSTRSLLNDLVEAADTFDLNAADDLCTTIEALTTACRDAKSYIEARMTVLVQRAGGSATVETGDRLYIDRKPVRRLDARATVRCVVQVVADEKFEGNVTERERELMTAAVRLSTDLFCSPSSRPKLGVLSSRGMEIDDITRQHDYKVSLKRLRANAEAEQEESHDEP